MPMPARPMPADPEDQTRWAHSSMRHKLLDGEWEELGNDMLANHFGEDRRESKGVLDMSSCPVRQIAGELAVLYHRPPLVSHRSEDVSELCGPGGLLSQVGLWTKMRELQRYCWTLREYFVRVDYSVTRDRIIYRLVSPHNVISVSDVDECDRPLLVRELRSRVIDGEDAWTWDVLDIRDPGNPQYRVELQDRGKLVDITEAVLGGDKTGDNYPYRKSDGTPILPYVLYHAKDTGRLWNAHDGIEAIIGSLNAAVYWTWAGVAAKDASFRTIIVIGADADGVSVRQSVEDGGAPVRYLRLEPGAIQFLNATGDGQALVQEVGPGAQVADLEEFATRYERRVAVFAGISPSDIQRQGGDARSGYAIAISNQGKREAQAQQIEIYRRYDQELLSVTACIVNEATGTNYPEDGYILGYQPIPKTPEELRAEREEVEFELQHGFIAPHQALMRRRPGLSEEQARAVIARNKSETRMLRDAGLPRFE